MTMSSSAVPEGADTLNLIVSPPKSFQKSLPINIPNSAEGYRQRVDTFTVFRWLGHQPSVSPLECARWGWECVETDLLRCVSCRAFVYGRNDDLLANKENDAKLKLALVQSHKSYCIWSSTSSPTTFYTLQFASHDVCRESFLVAIRAFSHLPKCAIPSLDLSSLVTPPFEAETSSLLSSLEPEREKLAVAVEAWKPLLTLVLCGWTLATDKTTRWRLWRRLCIKIDCRFCRRSLGLWQYKPAFPSEAPVVNRGGSQANGNVLQHDAADRKTESKQEDREKVVAIVSGDSFVSPSLPPDEGSSFKILHPKSPPPKTATIVAEPLNITEPLAEATEGEAKVDGEKAAEEKHTPKLNRRSWKKSPEKAEVAPPSVSPSQPSEIRTRSQSQSSPGNDQDGMTTRRGTIMRSPSGEPPIAAMKSAMEKKKRQRSGDSNHSGGEGEDRAQRSSKRLATAASDADDRGRKLSGGSGTSTSSRNAKVGVREVDDEIVESECEEEMDSCVSIPTEETFEPMEFGTALLNPVAEHRSWCPYALVNYTFGEEEESLPAWEYVKRCLEASFGEVATATSKPWLDDHLEKARKLMGF